MPSRPGRLANKTVRERYVAIFDILGFQEIITRNWIGHVADLFETFTFISGELARTAPRAIRSRLQFLIFQDTVLVYTHAAAARDIEALLQYSNMLLSFALADGIRLRGAITRGRLVAKSSGILGPALVRAYRMSQEQEWVGCWVHEACVPRSARTRTELIRYPVPLKTGLVRKRWVLDWAGTAPADILGAAWVELLKGRPAAWDVRRKVRNTYDFIAYSLMARHGSHWRDGLVARVPRWLDWPAPRRERSTKQSLQD